MHESLQNFQILHSRHLDVLLRSRHDMHLPAAQFRHQRTRSHGVGDALLLSLLMGSHEVLQSESLWRLRAYQLVARNAGACTESVLALKYRLAAFYSRYGISVFLACGDVG